MRTKTLISVVVMAALLLSAFTGPAGADAKKKKKKKAGPVIVGVDDAGDWGANADPMFAPLGDVLGQDLVEARIEMADKETINFIITLNALPPTGGIPESSRYTWDFIADGNAFNMSGAFTEYIRGVCNPLHTGACPPPQDPGMAAFFIRHGPCTVGADCFVDAWVNATFDAAAGTITIPVPLEAIQAKPGSKIAPGATAFGGTVYAVPALLVTQASMPNDILIGEKTFTVPK